MVGQGARHRNAAQCDHVENCRATAKEQPEQRAPIEQLRHEVDRARTWLQECLPHHPRGDGSNSVVQ